LIRNLVREPLLHFIVLGAALFAAYGFWGKTEGQAEKIVVTQSQVANLSEGFARTWRRPPTDQELQGLIEEQIKDEIFYREGKAAGLDRDDVLIKRRVRQKLEFIANDVVALEPTDEQLASYLAARPDRFMSGDGVSFRHVFFSDSRSQPPTADELTRTRLLLEANPDEALTTAGDAFLLGGEFKSVSQAELGRAFGEGFARELFRAEPGRWTGPIRSGYGAHLVLVTARTSGSVPPLDKIRSAVQREWINEKKIENEQKFYRTLRSRYEVVVEPAKPKAGG